MGNKVKNIICVLGSPRKNGNSATLADEVKNGALSVGAKVDDWFLQDMRILPCTGCGSCKEPGARGCAINDDMGPLYQKLEDADGFIFASPVYWAGVSAQFKTFLDRCYAASSFEPFHTPFTGKKAAVALAFGGPDVVESCGVDVIRMMKDIFEFVKCKIGRAHV